MAKLLRFPIYLLIFALVAFGGLGVIPHAGAYSYGDPNKELAADVYEQMVGDLAKEPPQFTEAQAAFDQVKDELKMHMGNQPVQLVQQALDDKNKENVITLMQKVLVLNVARRLKAVDVKDYTNAKLLLAKGLSTYKALSPIVSKSDPSLDKKVLDEFDKSLQFLGNPGLFGVGEKNPDPAAFNQSRDFILSSLQKVFNMKSLDVGHFVDEGKESLQTPGAASAGKWSPMTIWYVLGGIGILVLISYLFKKKK